MCEPAVCAIQNTSLDRVLLMCLGTPCQSCVLQIGDNLTKFGINDNTKDVLLARIDATDDQVRWLGVLTTFAA